MDRQAEEEAGGRTNRQAHIHAGRQTGRRTLSQKDVHASRRAVSAAVRHEGRTGR